jgi:hypothetical protein
VRAVRAAREFLKPWSWFSDSTSVFASRYMPCPDCGDSVEQAERENHLCEPERWLDYQLFQLREEVDSFEVQLGAYLASPRGRFELWYAARRGASGSADAA